MLPSRETTEVDPTQRIRDHPNSEFPQLHDRPTERSSGLRIRDLAGPRESFRRADRLIHGSEVVCKWTHQKARKDNHEKGRSVHVASFSATLRSRLRSSVK